MDFISVIIFFLAVQSDGKPSLMSVAISTVVLGLIVLQMVVSKITVEKDKLIAGGGLYKVKVPWSEINIDEVVRLAPDDSFRLGWRKRSEEHTSEPQSLMRTSYAVFCMKKNRK